VTDLRAFWRSIWDYFEVESPTPFRRTVLAEQRMPGACWFPGAQVNYARQVLRHAARPTPPATRPSCSSDEAMAAPVEIELARAAAPGGRAGAATLRRRRRAGRPRGGLPAQHAEAIVAFLAAASLGAVWSLCSPDMGPVAVLDRFRQIDPRC
jgi:acetoacetyl-CoA synthetase